MSLSQKSCSLILQHSVVLTSISFLVRIQQTWQYDKLVTFFRSIPTLPLILGSWNDLTRESNSYLWCKHFCSLSLNGTIFISMLNLLRKPLRTRKINTISFQFYSPWHVYQFAWKKSCVQITQFFSMHISARFLGFP